MFHIISYIRLKKSIGINYQKNDKKPTLLCHNGSYIKLESAQGHTSAKKLPLHYLKHTKIPATKLKTKICEKIHKIIPIKNPHKFLK